MLPTLITVIAIGTACAVLSVIVVLRRWAMIGEGIAHAGFGGIGTAWLLSLAIPALGGETAAYLIGVLFCLIVALGIGFFSRRQRFDADTAIGIFLVASVAWGVVAFDIFARHNTGVGLNWEKYLVGHLDNISRDAMLACVSIAAAVLLTVFMLGKEILAYAFDPMLAEVSGVRTRLIHYLLMILLALVIVIGMGVVGNLLIPALLVLPGATALSLSRKLSTVMAISIVSSLLGTISGLLMHTAWPFIPSGAAMVLTLFGLFILAFIWEKMRRCG